ncbi:methylmalonyl-CoA mutase subunit beta [Altibacter lentus]|uniref:methylmalonyl-CoA mutase subunit beta n=1 Tax=Altibacter lentus TaxID=1223410 RepID=UPI00054E8B1F|nr:methylmalonyl-CoA mutase subunit beta [Altibacter lentus]
MSKFLFDKFDPVSAKQWKQKIQYELKGADYNETLVWNSPEGIDVKPFYHGDDVSHPFGAVPGAPQSWSIGQAVFIDDEKIANTIARDAVKRGAETVYFIAAHEFDIPAVFAEFPFDTTPIYFEWHFLSEAFLLLLKEYLNANKAVVYYNVDLVGNLARTGNWYHNLKQDHTILESIFQKDPSANILSVDSGLYQNAGATMVQQLAYALAHAHEYLNHLSGKGMLAPQTTVTFQVAVGSNYFFEIAKIRALRKLYAVLAEEYGLSETCHIMATPSKRNKTLYDYNVNMLRTTTECMSAVLGGANMVCNMAYDAIYHKSNEFGERIARNQLLILKAESYFDAVSNPADGAYYLESLTAEMAQKALDVFKTIEAGGGFLTQLKDGTLQRKIKESAEKEQALFDSGDLKLVGTNIQQHPDDRMKDTIELFPFVKTKARKTLLAPIIEKRLAEKVEQQRLDHE